jgi:hypothetical protein
MTQVRPSTPTLVPLWGKEVLFLGSPEKTTPILQSAFTTPTRSNPSPKITLAAGDNTFKDPPPAYFKPPKSTSPSSSMSLSRDSVSDYVVSERIIKQKTPEKISPPDIVTGQQSALALERASLIEYREAIERYVLRLTRTLEMDTEQQGSTTPSEASAVLEKLKVFLANESVPTVRASSMDNQPLTQQEKNLPSGHRPHDVESTFSNDPESPTPLPRGSSVEHPVFPETFFDKDGNPKSPIAQYVATTVRQFQELAKPKQRVDDTASSVDGSMLSEESNPRPALLPFSVRYVKEERSMFVNFYRSMDSSFHEWENRLHFRDGRIRAITDDTDPYLVLEDILEPNVVFGKRPGGSGFWTGWLGTLKQNQPIVKLKREEDDIIFGTVIGEIEDFGCYDASLFMGIDRLIYFTSATMGGDDCDKDGWTVYIVHGPYDLRTMGSDVVLNPACDF